MNIFGKRQKNAKINKKRDSNPSKSSDFHKSGAKMGNLPVDRNKNYMREVWGTTSLTTDYWSLSKNTKDNKERVIQEIMHDDLEENQKNLQE
jgi:hypothetical protein